MQLNEVHNDHEHASVSLKVILLVFAVILVGALGYFVWDFQNTPDTTDYSTPKITKTETTSEETTEDVDETADWKTDTNTDWGFSVKYPAEWTYAEDSEGGTTLISFTPPGSRDFTYLFSVREGWMVDDAVNFEKDTYKNGYTYLGLSSEKVGDNIFTKVSFEPSVNGSGSIKTSYIIKKGVGTYIFDGFTRSTTGEYEATVKLILESVTFSGN